MTATSSNSTRRRSSTIGDKVRARRTVRNDGTYAARRSATSSCKKGEEGYVVSIGTFLQQFYIYGVEFVDSGNRVGMKRKELELAMPREEQEIPLAAELPA